MKTEQTELKPLVKLLNDRNQRIRNNLYFVPTMSELLIKWRQENGNRKQNLYN